MRPVEPQWPFRRTRRCAASGVTRPPVIIPCAVQRRAARRGGEPQTRDRAAPRRCGETVTPAKSLPRTRSGAGVQGSLSACRPRRTGFRPCAGMTGTEAVARGPGRVAPHSCIGGRPLRARRGARAAASRHRGQPHEDLAAAGGVRWGRRARHPSSGVIPCAAQREAVRRRHGTAFATPYLPPSSRSSGGATRRPDMAAPTSPPPRRHGARGRQCKDASLAGPARIPHDRCRRGARAGPARVHSLSTTYCDLRLVNTLVLDGAPTLTYCFAYRVSWFRGGQADNPAPASMAIPWVMRPAGGALGRSGPVSGSALPCGRWSAVPVGCWGSRFSRMGTGFARAGGPQGEGTEHADHALLH